MKLSAILTTVVFAGIAFAAPHPNGGLARRVERRAGDRASRGGNPSKHVITNSEKVKGSGNTSHTVYSTNWAGAVIESPPSGEAFNTIAGQFTVPTPSAPSGSDANGDYSAAIWVGIDGDTYGNAIWQAGIDLSISDGQVSYDAWYEWFPIGSVDIDGFSCSPGDVISIILTANSPSEGSVFLENISTGQSFMEIATAPNSDAALAGQNAEWIVEDYDVNGSEVAFANFDSVLFTNAVAATQASVVGTEGATIFNLVDSNNNLLTDSSLPSSSQVGIKYLN